MAAPEASGVGGVSLVGGIWLLVPQAVGVQHCHHPLRVQHHPLGNTIEEGSLHNSANQIRCELFAPTRHNYDLRSKG